MFYLKVLQRAAQVFVGVGVLVGVGVVVAVGVGVSVGHVGRSQNYRVFRVIYRDIWLNLGAFRRTAKHDSTI